MRRRWRAVGRRSTAGKSLTRPVTLKEPVAIHVEYYVVRVGPQGEVHFLSDIYGLDRRRLSPRSAPRRCAPETVLARRRFQTLERRILTLEHQATTLASCSAQGGAAEGRLQKRLASFDGQFKNLAQHTRQRHAVVAAEFKQSARGWTYALSKRAVGVERLYKALFRLTKRAQRSCRALSRS
ncbi:MAG: hypothetical protein JRH20_22365 [Deltaproteobacteria bacterium]|nr:hypothetical protein [Deltaproteobacteria bacterium]